MMLHHHGHELRFHKISDRIANHSLILRKEIFNVIKIQLCKTTHLIHLFAELGLEGGKGRDSEALSNFGLARVIDVPDASGFQPLNSRPYLDPRGKENAHPGK